MTLLRYLLEYTIEVVCDGNRSACARRLGMEYSELRKIRKRMSEGSGSNRAMEALLEMYWREGLSLDEALRQYSTTELGADLEARERACNELIGTMFETLQAESDNTQRAAYMLKAAHLPRCGRTGQSLCAWKGMLRSAQRGARRKSDPRGCAGRASGRSLPAVPR